MAKSRRRRRVRAQAEITIERSRSVRLRALAQTLSSLSVDAPPRPEGIDISARSMPLATDVPGGEREPVYGEEDQTDIQGNILPGFNKGEQRFLFFSLGRRREAKKFLEWLTPHLSSLKEVVAFRRLHRERRLRVGPARTFLASTWVNVGISHPGIAKLTKKSVADSFGDASFRLGLAERSTYLGDPSSRSARGNATKWKVGGPDNRADVVIIVASDLREHADGLSELIKSEAADHDMELIFEQPGSMLPGPLRGHEHFGFRDGISQPGVRGKLSKAPGDYITPRYIADSDDRRRYFAKPGQLLVWPGQFLLGEPRQSTENLLKKAEPQENFPNWARRGSYLVIRRLRQDVGAFWSFAMDAAASLGIEPTEFASRLVGRWPSGAPLVRAPKSDDAALGADEFANNHFLFDDGTRNIELKEIPGYPGDKFPSAAADFLATVCPHFAHIRKVNPRESVTDLGKPEDNLARMILRRGIPYGDPIVGRRPLSRREISMDRGLIFACYNASIEDQFEFLQRRWSNSEAQPNVGGFDPIIGQNGSTAGRERFIDFPRKNGATTRIRFKEDFVVPTGGGYFFAPTIGAVRDVLAK